MVCVRVIKEHKHGGLVFRLWRRDEPLGFSLTANHENHVTIPAAMDFLPVREAFAVRDFEAAMKTLNVESTPAA